MFRNYDPAIGRFTGVDPLATQYASISGYHYAGNNPVMMNDPTGAWSDNGTNSMDANGDGMTDANYGCNCGPDNSWWTTDGPVGEGYGTPYGAGPGNSNTGYAHSNAPDAWNVMNNFSNGVPNSIATGISSSVPVNAWQSAMIYSPWGGEDLGGNRYGGKWIRLNSTEGRALYKNQYGKNSGVVIQTGGGPQTWYYMYKSEGGPHGLAYDPYTNTIYDVNHPNGGNTNGLKSWLNGGAKSVGYKYDMSNPSDVSRFWSFGGGRGTLLLAPVQIPNPAAATAFFESNTDKEWDYNFFTNNCKHAACQGFTAGGAEIPTLGPDPSLWGGSFTMYWNSSMATPARVAPQQMQVPDGPGLNKR